jgi:hypothetical protein
VNVIDATGDEAFLVTTWSPQVTIFSGRFGSGKTEIALNYALALADRGAEPLLVDLDIVTPYFRTREKAAEIRQYGVQIVTPFAVGQHIHIPAISPVILGTIEQSQRPVVLDVGGDVQGARALSLYATAIAQHTHEMHFVVNPYRPFMDTVDGVASAVREIETSAGLQVSSLVSNPNMMSSTTPALLYQGHALVEVAAQALGLPISLLVVSETLAKQMAPRVNLGSADSVLVIHRFFLMFDTP